MAVPEVFLFPAGFGEEALFVIVEAPTGVEYTHQYGGTRCLHGRVEGYLVPLFADEALLKLRRIFEGELRGSGVDGEALPPGLRERLESTVGEIPFWKSEKGDTADCLVVDRSRFEQLDEAWIPVLTLDGPGILVWLNSD